MEGENLPEGEPVEERAFQPASPPTQPSRVSESRLPSPEISRPRAQRFQPWRYRDEAALTVGFILALVGTLFLLAGLALQTSPKDSDRGVGLVSLFICAPIFLVPCLLLIRQGVRWRRRQAQLEGLVNYLNARREARLSELTRYTGLTTTETLALLDEAQSRGLVAGELEIGEARFRLR